jgi:hypothetical protein
MRRPRRPDSPMLKLERLCRAGRDLARQLRHDLGRFERSTDYGAGNTVSYRALASCRTCGAQARVSTCADVGLEGAAVQLTCQQVRLGARPADA